MSSRNQCIRASRYLSLLHAAWYMSCASRAKECVPPAKWTVLFLKVQRLGKIYNSSGREPQQEKASSQEPCRKKLGDRLPQHFCFVKFFNFWVVKTSPKNWCMWGKKKLPSPVIVHGLVIKQEKMSCFRRFMVKRVPLIRKPFQTKRVPPPLLQPVSVLVLC